jgi:transcription antitermination factor NusG
MGKITCPSQWSDLAMDGYWALVTTLPNCERRAALNLKFQGIETFAPRYRKIFYINGGGSYERTFFMFPSYLFVRVADAWRSLLGTRGVAGVVGGASPSRAPDGLVERLISDEQQNGGAIKLPHVFEIGQSLLVKNGHLRGTHVIYDGMSRHGREKVLLSAMGGNVSVELFGSDLEVALN